MIRIWKYLHIRRTSRSRFAGVLSLALLALFGSINYAPIIPDMGVKSTQAYVNATAPTPDANGMCPGVNSLNPSDKNYKQPAATVNGKKVCYGVYRAGDVNPYTGQVLTGDCKVGTWMTGYGNAPGRVIDPYVGDCASRGYTALKASSRILPQLTRGVAGQGAAGLPSGCYTRIFWNADGVASPRQICGTPTSDGTFCFQDCSNSSTGNTANSGGTNNTNNTTANQLFSEPFGEITSISCQKVDGWAVDPLHFDTPLTLKVYVRKAGQTTDQFTSLTVIANVARTDIFPAATATKLGINPTVFAAHGYTFTMPSGVAEGDTVTIYAVKANSSWTPLVGEARVVCAGATSSRNSQAQQNLNSVVSAIQTSAATSNSNNTRTTSLPTNDAPPPRTASGIESSCVGVARCYIPTGDGGNSCALTERGITPEEIASCRARVEACIGNDSRVITGACDPGRYYYCRQAGPPYADPPAADGTLGRVNYEACDQAVQNGCNMRPGDPNIQTNAGNCDTECVILKKGCDTPGTPPPPAGGNPPPAANPPPAQTPPPGDHHPCDPPPGNPHACDTSPPAPKGGDTTTPPPPRG